MYHVNQLPGTTEASPATQVNPGPVVKPPRRPRQAILRTEQDREGRDGRQGMWLRLYRQGEYSF